MSFDPHLPVGTISSHGAPSDLDGLRSTLEGTERAACLHEPRCPAADGLDRDAAQAIVRHPEQGWSLLCNGVVMFEDSGEILPDGHCTHAPRAALTAAAMHRKVA